MVSLFLSGQEMMSETSIDLRSQPTLADINISIDSDGGRIAPLGLSQAQRYARQKPRFVEFACSFAEVCLHPRRQMEGVLS